MALVANALYYLFPSLFLSPTLQKNSFLLVRRTICHQACLLGSQYQKYAIARGDMPQIPLGKINLGKITVFFS